MPAERAFIDDLVLEVTRRCNLSCAHCLRGDAEEANLQPEVVNAIWRKIGHIGRVTFTGGEPLLNPAGIVGFLDARKKADGSVGSFYIATNGYVADAIICAAIARAFASAEEPELNLLHVSNTGYHVNSGRSLFPDRRQEWNYQTFKTLFRQTALKSEEYDKKTEYSSNTMPPLVARGRARYKEDATDSIVGSSWEFADDQISNEHLYITVTGDCYPFCDLSYSDFAALKANKSPLYLGNIKDPRVTPFLMARHWNEFVKNCGGSVKLRDHI